jgi:predicted helicase
MPMGDKDDDSGTIFSLYSRGLATSRDSWCYSFSGLALASNMSRMARFYRAQVDAFDSRRSSTDRKDIVEAAADFIDTDPKKISWSRGLIADLAKGTLRPFKKEAIRESAYRAFTKQWVYFDRAYNDMVYKLHALFPTPNHPNTAICTTSAGNRGEFSTLITTSLPDLNFCGTGSAAQCFPFYLYEKADHSGGLQFDRSHVVDGYRRRDAIADGTLKTFVEAYGKAVTKQDIFYYVYGVLNSPEYRTRFAADLKKMLPRIPLTKEAKDFNAFSDAGRKLAKWHLNYESVPAWPVEEIHDKLDLGLEETYKVSKMTFGRPTTEQKAAGAKWDKTRIIYNSHLTISKIPLEAYDYVVNGKPAVEWIIERYQVTRDKDSGIVNDPNEWCREHNQPRYIVDLIGRVVRVSMETMSIVKTLPALNERKDVSTTIQELECGIKGGITPV